MTSVCWWNFQGGTVGGSTSRSASHRRCSTSHCHPRRRLAHWRSAWYGHRTANDPAVPSVHGTTSGCSSECWGYGSARRRPRQPGTLSVKSQVSCSRCLLPVVHHYNVLLMYRMLCLSVQGHNIIAFLIVASVSVCFSFLFFILFLMCVVLWLQLGPSQQGQGLDFLGQQTGASGLSDVFGLSQSPTYIPAQDVCTFCILHLLARTC